MREHTGKDRPHEVMWGRISDARRQLQPHIEVCREVRSCERCAWACKEALDPCIWRSLALASVRRGIAHKRPALVGPTLGSSWLGSACVGTIGCEDAHRETSELPLGGFSTFVGACAEDALEPPILTLAEAGPWVHGSMKFGIGRGTCMMQGGFDSYEGGAHRSRRNSKAAAGGVGHVDCVGSMQGWLRVADVGIGFGHRCRAADANLSFGQRCVRHAGSLRAQTFSRAVGG